MSQDPPSALRTRKADRPGNRQPPVHALEPTENHGRNQVLQRSVFERERQISGLSTVSIAALEEERQWIACEVHDRIAQTLASVFQQIQTLESMVRPQPQARQVAARASVLLKEAIREARNIMNELHPPILEELGVGPLIEEELRRFEEDTGCGTAFTAAYLVRLPRDVEVTLYRIFHEALINIRRHAPNARHVGVTVASTDGAVSLRVQDDGPGFDIETAMQNKRVGGLMSMRRRAEFIGGTLEMTSIPGQGTTVNITAPVAPRK